MLMDKLSKCVDIFSTALNLSGLYPPPSGNRYRLAHEEFFMAATQQRFSVIGDRNLNDLRKLINVPIADSLEPWCH